MCGRTRCTLGRAQLERVVPGTQRWINEASYEPCHNAAPGRDLPIIHQTAEGEVVIETARWGLVPAFTKPTDKPNHWSMFNARSESVTEKPSFRRLVPVRRCLVALDGFYEWKKEKDGKQPYYLHLAGDEPMVIAGLYDAWQSPSGPLVSFTILTSDASPRLAWLHDRQPLLLHSREAQALWLDTGNPASVNKLQTVLGSSYGGEDLVWHAVTRAMSRIGYQAPDASAPLTKPAAADFFKPRKKAAAASPLPGAAAAQDGSAGAAAREGGRAGPVHTERLTAEGAAGGMQPKLEQQEGGGAAEGREVKQEPASQEVKPEPAAEAVNADERPGSCAGGMGSRGAEGDAADDEPSRKRRQPDSNSSGSGDGGGGESAPPPQPRQPQPASAGAALGTPSHKGGAASAPAKSPGGSAARKKKARPPGQTDISQFFSKSPPQQG